MMRRPTSTRSAPKLILCYAAQFFFAAFLDMVFCCVRDISFTTCPLARRSPQLGVAGQGCVGRHVKGLQEHGWWARGGGSNSKSVINCVRSAPLPPRGGPPVFSTVAYRQLPPPLCSATWLKPALSAKPIGSSSAPQPPGGWGLCSRPFDCRLKASSRGWALSPCPGSQGPRTTAGKVRPLPRRQSPPGVARGMAQPPPQSVTKPFRLSLNQIRLERLECVQRFKAQCRLALPLLSPLSSDGRVPATLFSSCRNLCAA